MSNGLIDFRRRPKRRYSKTHNDPKDLQIEQPYLASSAAIVLPQPGNHHNRPNSASSTTSSIIMHQMNDGISDRETLIKPIGQISSHSNGDIDNFYEEIKEQQQQTALALGINGNKGDIYIHNKILILKKRQNVFLIYLFIFFKVINQSHPFVIIMRYFIMNVKNK